MKQPDLVKNIESSSDDLNHDSRKKGNRGLALRAFELDMLRGLAILMMILHHFIFDLRHLLGIDVFAFQDTWWFDALLRPVFLFVFLTVSGICCTFSRSNSKRGLKMALAALLFTLATTIVWQITDMQLAIFFNILHLLAIGTIIYALLEKLLKQKSNLFTFLLLFPGAVIIWAASTLPEIPDINTYLLLPLGILPPGSVGMGDYMPIIPWLGFFLIGAAIGRLFYADRSTLFPDTPDWINKAVMPLNWLGRNALWVYIFHQPVLLVLLFGLRFAGII